VPELNVSEVLRPSDARTEPRPTLSIVIPCFNEAENVPAVHRRIAAAAAQCGASWELVFVDDGSRDETRTRLAELCRRDPRVRAVVFSRNFGHQAALTAGLMVARGAAVVTLDADLQHPPELITRFLALWREGAKVVQAVRRSTPRGAGKAVTSRVFYAWLNRLTEVPIEPNAADYRLLDRRVVDYLNAMPERARFLRGQLAWLGFPSVRLPYDEDQRHAGTSKYTLAKMLDLARDGLTTSSLKPLYLSAWLGFALTLGALGYGAFGLTAALLGHAVRGWTSLMLAVLGIGAIELIVLSIHGLYVAQLHKEMRARPLFCVAETYGLSSHDEDAIVPQCGGVIPIPRA
jgi:dolichol-phosphate mannosyltransferase